MLFWSLEGTKTYFRHLNSALMDMRDIHYNSVCVRVCVCVCVCVRACVCV